MKKNPMPHFLPTALLAATALSCALCATPARAWTSISVPGSIYASGQWDTTTHLLSTHSGNVWSGSVAVDQNGDFKFAANKSWDNNWGGASDIYIQRLPATGIGPLASYGKDIHLQALSGPATLGFSFDDKALTFTITTPNPPSVSAARLVGSFNDDGAADATSGVLVRGSDGLWTADLTLASADNLRLRVNDTEDWGPPAAVSSPVPLTVPLCSSSPFSVDDFRPGDFRATFDPSDLTLTLVQTRTNVFTAAAIAADGTLTPLARQNVNLVKDGSVWTGTFWVTASEFTLSFSQRDENGSTGGLYWSASGSTPVTLSANAYTETFTPVTSASAVVRRPFKTAAGLYRITFDPDNGAATVQRVYTAGSKVNLFQDPSFETGAGWAEPYNAVRLWGTNDAPGLHTGNGVAMFLPVQRHPTNSLGNYGSVSASFDVSKYRGSTLRVSAWFRIAGPWNASKTRIWIEWKDDAWNTVSEVDSTLHDLSSFWQPFSLDAVVPEDAVQANVLFAFTGSAEGDGYLLIDDAEARISADRFLDFDTWTTIEGSTFKSYPPDWKISSGRTTNNLSDAFVESGNLFISKYIEGSNNNKAIELFNPTTAKIDLSGWKLQQYDNGSSTPTATFALSGTVATGACFLITRTIDFTAADGEKYAPLVLDPALAADGVADLRLYGLTFNGDDAIVLLDPSGNVADRVGQVRSDITGSLLAYVMRDHTLVRSSYTAHGTTGDPTNAFPYSEWEIRPCDDFSDLKSHVRVLPPDVYIPSGLSLVLNSTAILSSPDEPLDGGIGDVSFWYRTAFSESATSNKNGSVTLVVEASTVTNFAASNTVVLTNLVVPATQYAYSNFVCHADLAEATYFRIRSTNATGGAYARIDDLSVGKTIQASRYQDFNTWTNASWQTYIGNYSLGGWSIANGRLDFANGASATPAAVLPSDATVTSPSFDAGVGQIRFATSADPNDEDSSSYSLAVEFSTDGGATWERIDSISGSGASNWVSQAVTAGASANAAVRFVSTGPGNVLLDNIELWIPEEDSRSQTFDAWVQNSYGTSKHQGWTISSALTSTDAGMNSTRGLRVKSSGAWVQSPVLEGGVGTVSFYARPSSGSATPGFALEALSAGSTKWTNVKSFRLYGSESTDWQAFAVPIDSDAVTQVRLVLTNSQALCIENIVCARLPVPPALSVSAFLDPEAPYPDEAFTIGAYVNPIGSARQSDIESVVANYRFQKGSAVTTGTVPLAYSALSGAWLAPSNFPGLADGTKIVYSASATWTSNGTSVVTTSPNATNFVSALANSGVWINEVFYAINTNYDTGDIWFGGSAQDHEYIEICGPAGTDISGWKLELQVSRPVEIAAVGKAAYATYTVPKNTPALADEKDGYGFFLFGDNNAEWTADLAFTDDKLVPEVLNASAAADRDHLYDGAGTIVLKNAQNVPVDAVSYSLAVSGTTSIGSQEGLNPTNALSAVGGPGYSGDSFTWNASQAPTPGAANLNQSFTNRSTTSKTTPFAWHVVPTKAEDVIVPNQASTDPFYLVNPWPFNVSSNVSFNLAFPHADYDPDKAHATLYYRILRNGEYVTDDFVSVGLDLHENAEASTNAFLWSPDDPAVFPAYFFRRLDTVEYYFVFEPGESDKYTAAYISSDGAGGSVNLPDTAEGSAAAEATPFSFTFPFHDTIEIRSLGYLKDVMGALYPFADTVSFPSDPDAYAKIAFFDADRTSPPAEDELALEATPSLLTTNAWDRIRWDTFGTYTHGSGSDDDKGTYYYIEFVRPTNSAAFFRISPSAPQ